MNRVRIKQILPLISCLFVLVLAIGSVSAASYPYNNYYGPSDGNYFKETTSKSAQSSQVIVNNGFYSSQSSSSSQKTTTENRYEVPQYYYQPKYSQFDDIQYPTYHYIQQGYYPNSSFNRPTVSYISGYNPNINGYGHYYDNNYYYQPQYDWHLGYYNWAASAYN